MLIEYRFSIYDGVETRIVKANYIDKITKEITMEEGERFFREDIPEAITIYRDDYDWVKSHDFETQYILKAEISYNNGSSWRDYWTGRFYETDCSFDEDNKIMEIKAVKYDDYTEVLSGLNKTFNLIKLPIKRTSVNITKRPLIQMYVPGDSVVGCYMAGVSWEQQVVATEDDTGVLTGTYGFGLATTLTPQIYVTGSGIPQECVGAYVSVGVTDTWENKDGSYKIVLLRDTPSTGFYQYEIVRVLDDERLFLSGPLPEVSEPPLEDGKTINFSFVVGSGSSGSLTGTVSVLEVYGRILTDATTILSNPTTAIGISDLVAYNRNYSYSYPYTEDCVIASSKTVETPTEYGLSEDGRYFTVPDDADKYYPLARNSWALLSYWFVFTDLSAAIELDGRVEYTFKDAYLIEDVIQVLLDQIAPDITHSGLSEYSEFLYGGANPLSGDSFRLMLTQKSNIIEGEYDSPAQKVEINLNDVFSMLKGLECFWFIEDKKLKIEHVAWFKRGGSYTQQSAYAADLTLLKNAKNDKLWSFNTGKYSFNKEELPERYEFDWMDDVSNPFEGYPIQITSKMALEGNVKTITMSRFTSDIDYILLNPEEVSKDGFALMAAVLDNSVYSLPFVEVEYEGVTLELQNGYMSWPYIHPNFWKYDLPSRNATVNDRFARVLDVKASKKQQVDFISTLDPNPLNLIKTSLGSGQIEKLTIYLHSRLVEAQLKHKPRRSR